MAIASMTLTGTYQNLDGSPASGKVRIDVVSPTGGRVIDSTGNVVFAGPRTIVLDTAGHFSIGLPSDVTTGESTTIAYRVTAQLKHNNLAPLEFWAKASGSTWDVADIATQVVAPVTATAVTTADLDSRTATNINTAGTATQGALSGTYVRPSDLTMRGAVRIDPSAMRASHAAAPQVTPTYDGTGQAVHPSVQFYPEGWNGYRYWMAMTPYPNGVDTTENPSILASNDGATWVEPPGIVNPIDKPATGFYPDPDLIDVDGTLWCTYAVGLAKSSTDGVNWSARQTMTGLGGSGRVSQTIVRPKGNGQEFWVWYVNNAASPYTLQLLKSTTGILGPYSAPAACTVTGIPTGRDLWHIQIRKVGGQYVGLFTVCDAGTTGTNTALHFATSTDGTAWTVAPSPLLEKAPGTWASQQVYRSALVPYDGRDGALFGLWYSAAANPNTWRIGYTVITSNAATKGLAGTSAANKFAAGQRVQGSAKNRLPNASLMRAASGAVIPLGYTNNLVGATGHAWDEATESYTYTVGGFVNFRINVADTYTSGDVWTFSYEGKMASTATSSQQAKITWLDGAGAAIGSTAASGPEKRTEFGVVQVSSTVPAGAVTATLEFTTNNNSGSTQFWHRRAQWEKAPVATAWEPPPAVIERAVPNMAGNLHEWQTDVGAGKGARTGVAITKAARVALENLTATPTDAATVGELCVVNGVVKVCTAAGTPGTWVSVGAQT